MQNNFDMIHTHWIIPQGLVQCLFRKPYLVTGHGGDVTSLNIGPLKKWKQLCLKRAGYCTAVSEKLKRIMLEICPEARISVIPMGCDTKAFGRKHRIENYFDQGNHKMILFVGRLAEKKGVTYLIKAMKEIDGKLAIVGQGPLENQLKEQVVQEGLEQKIVFLGSKTHEELRSIYASADIFVMPSITAKDGDEEGFGLVMLEAMASGLPIVASSSGGIVDLIHHEDTGLLVEEKDVDQLAAQINRLCYDDSLYKELQQSSIKHVQAYDYKIIAQRYYDIIEGIMKGKTVKDE